MLPEENRLRLQKEHDFVYKNGLRYKSPFFLLLCVKTNSSKPSRFSFIVSKKIDKRAVVRNRIRRIMRESVRNLLGRINFGYDCIVIGSGNLIGKKSSDALPYFEKTFINAGLLKNESTKNL